MTNTGFVRLEVVREADQDVPCAGSVSLELSAGQAGEFPATSFRQANGPRITIQVEPLQFSITHFATGINQN